MVSDVEVSLCHCDDSFYIIHIYILGNHILPDEDLASFHWSLLGPEHPLASLKVQMLRGFPTFDKVTSVTLLLH